MALFSSSCPPGFGERGLTVEWSITYQEVSSLSVLEFAVTAPPPLEAIVHSPNQADAAPKI